MGVFKRLAMVGEDCNHNLAGWIPSSMANGIINGMTLKMDGAGRVVLPKMVRERLGLSGGSDLEMEVTAEGVFLRLSHAVPTMIQKDGLWVHTASVPREFDAVRAVEEDREERIRSLAGL
jgi:AbrB family looped-hinge helix DNA binding protein